MTELTPEAHAAMFGAKVRVTRETLGLSQRKLCKHINSLDLTDHFGRPVKITPAYVSRVESGDRFPSLTVVYALADALRVSRDWLLKS